MKLLIRTTNWVGDAIMAIPAIRAVRKKFPDSHIGILARPYVADIYQGQALCDELIPYDPKSTHHGWSGRERLARQLRAQKFDVALLLQNAFDAAWLAFRANIPQRIGYARDARSFLLTKAIPVPKPNEIPAHEMFYYLELLRRTGWIDALTEHSLPQGRSTAAPQLGKISTAASESFPNAAPPITLKVSDAQTLQARDTLSQAGSTPNNFRVAIAAGASYGSAKCWLPDRFAAVATHLQSQSNADIILFGTPSELPVSTAIAAAMPRKPIDLTGKTSIAALPALLSQCHLFLGNDSGAMHVAAAVGLPVVAIFGPTDPHGTAPVTPRHTIVQQKPYCSPCFLRRCPTDHRCMKSVTTEMVESAVNFCIKSLEVHPA